LGHNPESILSLSWPTIGAVIASIVGLITIYEKLIKPHTPKAKLHTLCNMVEQWFDEIDCNLENGLNLAKLNNMESKFTNYIRDNLRHYEIKPDIWMVRKWNKQMGFKESVLDDTNLFEQYSRLPATGMYLDTYIYKIIGNFLSFYKAYQEKSEQCNYAEVEMPIKFLKFYVENA